MSRQMLRCVRSGKTSRDLTQIFKRNRCRSLQPFSRGLWICASPSDDRLHSFPSVSFPSIGRPFSTAPIAKSSFTTKEDYLELNSVETTLNLPYLWLRDHCRCDKCYNHATNQKNILIQDQDAKIQPAKVELSDNGENLTITWPDGHVTGYSLPWLRVNAYPGPKEEKVAKLLWNKEVLTSRETLPRVDFEALVNGDDALNDLLHSLLKYGVGLVDGVPATLEDTQTAAERVCFIQRTMYGDMWSFTADASRGDTAYTNLTLGAHTDNSYLSVPAGIQVFHCVFHDGDGGETLLVDGFNAAEELRATNFEAFQTLCKHRICHENAEQGHHVRSLETILRLNPVTDALENIRYNQYDRAPVNTVPPRDVGKLYSAIGELGRIIARPENEFWIKLRAGTVLLVDNWRVMHGRASFTGNRRIHGCYLPRDDWIGKARILGLVWS